MYKRQAFGLGSVSGIAAGFYYLPHTTFATAALFLLADRITQRRGDLGDRLDPGPTIVSAGILGGLFFVTTVAVVGLPPLSGFLGKFLTLRAALAHPWLSLIHISTCCCLWDRCWASFSPRT